MFNILFMMEDYYAKCMELFSLSYISYMKNLLQSLCNKFLLSAARKKHRTIFLLNLQGHFIEDKGKILATGSLH